MNRTNKWTLRIPATSGNIGPGFDCFGLALGIYNSFSWSRADEFSLSFAGSVEIAADSRDLAKNYVIRAYKDTCAILGIKARPWAIHSEVHIPLRGGMGSSATAIIAGCAAALLQKQEDEEGKAGLNSQIRNELLQITSAMVMHPDNVAPAIYGGFVVSCINEGKDITARRFPVSDKIKCWVIMPQAEVSTGESRLGLAASISQKDAVFNISHASLTAVAFATQDYALLKDAMADRIHESQRDTIYKYNELKQKLLEGGALSISLSGSGPAILALVEKPNK